MTLSLVNPCPERFPYIGILRHGANRGCMCKQCYGFAGLYERHALVTERFPDKTVVIVVRELYRYFSSFNAVWIPVVLIYAENRAWWVEERAVTRQ